MSDRHYLVTGAGGFIGGRVTEILHLAGAGPVRAVMRRWATGARIGRLPVELVRCDIRNEAQAREAVRGITHIVHCAVGDRSSTVDGTRALLAAAAGERVERVVHLSTVDVYGIPEGDVAETHPIVRTGRPYGDSKIEAEEVCMEAATRGLPVTILRPTLVHGPFSGTWTVTYAQRLQKRPWSIPEGDAQGTCNLLYVDDLVGAVLRAFDARTAPGDAFNINGPERPTWHTYFKALNDAMGLPPLTTATPAAARIKSAAILPLRKTAKFVATRFNKQIMGLAQRSRLAREAMVQAEGLIRTTPVPSEFATYGRRVSYPSTKAEQRLGYRPTFSLESALPLTAGWLRDHGFVSATVD